MNDTTPYETIKISLPSDLASYVRRAADREDRTISGLIRRLVAEAARLEPPPPTPGAAKTLQNVEATPAGIEAAKARVAALRQQRDVIVKRSNRPMHEAAPATDDIEFRALAVEIEWTEKQIEMAERLAR
jgi:hypothetical protein